MKKLLKKTLKLILPVVLGGFILFWVYRDFDFTKAGDVLLHGTNWWWMLFSLVFGVFAQVFRGWRWRQTLEPLDAFPKKSDCVNAIFISYAASLVVPRIGEVSRCGVLAKYDNVSFAKSLNSRYGAIGRYIDDSSHHRHHSLASITDIRHLSSTDRNKNPFSCSSPDFGMVLYHPVLFYRCGDPSLLFKKNAVLL